MSDLFTVILPVFLIIGFGYLVAWRGWFSEVHVDGLMRFAQTFAVPVLLFTSIARLDLGAGFRINLMLAFYGGAFAGYLAGWLGAKFVFKRPPEDCVAIGFVCLFSNSLLLGVPITERAYGADALLGNWAIISIHSPLIYTFGITMMEFTRARGQNLSVGVVAGRALGGVLRTPLVVGILLGFGVNMLGKVGIILPEGFWAAADMIARAALPAALFGLGGVLYRYRPEGDMATIAMCCGVSLILHPAVAFAVGSGLGIGTDALRSAVVTASMAPGVNAYIFANLYGAAKRVAASAVLIGTALSVVTIWVWLQVLP